MSCLQWAGSSSGRVPRRNVGKVACLSQKYMKEGFVYILKSAKNGSFYIGSTIDTAIRLCQHNAGSVTATKHLTPWEMEYCQKDSTIREARQIEYRLKKLKRRDILEQIIREQNINIKGR